jgi:hypothetical protein
LLAHDQWFSPGTLVSSTAKTGRHDIAEILLNVALTTKNQIKIGPFLIHDLSSLFFLLSAFRFAIVLSVLRYTDSD